MQEVKDIGCIESPVIKILKPGKVGLIRLRNEFERLILHQFQ
jgi:hypothetical protein